MTSLEKVLSALESLGRSPKKSGAGYVARCPAHDDRDPSLSIGQGDRGVVFNCFAGCSDEAISEALGVPLPELFDDWQDRRRRGRERGNVVSIRRERPIPPATVRGTAVPEPLAEKASPAPFEVEAEYPYVDEAGEVLYVVERGKGKRFRQRKPDGAGGWVYKLGEVRRVLYGLPDVLATAAEHGTVYVVEGEKDALAINALRGEEATFVATTPAGGAAGRWNPEYTEALKGAGEVVVVADRDVAGRAKAAAIFSALREAGIAARIVEAREGKDAADHLSAGHAIEDLVDVTPKPEDDSEAEGPAEFDPEPLDLLDLLATDPPPIPTIVGPYLAAGDNVLVGGEWGSGKTPLVHALALALVTGKPFLGIVPVVSTGDGFRVGYLDDENGARLLHYRLSRTVRGLDLDRYRVADRLAVFSKCRWGDLTAPRARDALRRIVDRYKLTHLVLDSLVRFIGNRDENSSGDMSDWYGGGVEFFNSEHGCSVIAIHHWRKPPAGPGIGASDPRHRFRGSSDIPAQFDQVLAYDLTGEPNARNLIHVRSRWDDYAPLRIVEKVGTKADPSEYLRAKDAPATVETTVRNRLLADGAAGTLRQDLTAEVMATGLSKDAADRTLTRTLGELKGRNLAVGKKEGKQVRYWDYSFAPPGVREASASAGAEGDE